MVTELGETLRQTSIGVALTGDLTRFTGPSRSLCYRWFADPASRARYAPDEHDYLGRLFASGLRGVATQRGPASRAAAIVERLTAESQEFCEVWSRHEVGLRPGEHKQFVHPEAGALSLDRQRLIDPGHGHALLVYTATPGSESQDRLRLSVIGSTLIG